MLLSLRHLTLAAVVGTAVLILAMSLASAGDATQGVDCRSLTGTPTSTGTPTPTPPFTPYWADRLCNDTGESANDLHIVLTGESPSLNPISVNAPGCPQPGYTYDTDAPPYTSIDIEWQTACVDPGESVFVHIEANCNTLNPPCFGISVSCFYWTHDGQALPSTSKAPINPGSLCQNPDTPTPTPMPCPVRDTPPVTPPPTPFNPPPVYTGPPSTFRDAITQGDITYCSNAGQSASDLHIHFAHPYSGFAILQYPPGCPVESTGPKARTLDNFDMDIDWGQPCVDPGETMTYRLYFACYSECVPPQEFCYTWTLDGVPLDTDGACPQGLRGWGDNNCDHRTDALDALFAARALAAIPLTAAGNCPEMAHAVFVAGQQMAWGGVTCGGAILPDDVLEILRYVAVPTISSHPGCPPIGRTVVVDQPA